MNMLSLEADKRKSNGTIVEELKRESGGSFSIVYRALREVSEKSGGGTSLSKSDVLRVIHRMRSGGGKPGKK